MTSNTMTIDPPASSDSPTLRSAAPAEAQPRPLRQAAKPDKGGFIWGTGRRKSSIARVRMRPGSGQFLINKRPVEQYFSEMQHQNACYAALESTNTKGKVDIFVNAHGGGITGQAEAVLLGVARALLGYDPSLEPILRDKGYLTRDPRKVERKKYGLAGARRRFQFSKR